MARLRSGGPTNRRAWQLLGRLLRPHRGWIVVLLLMAAAQAALAAAGPWLVGVAIDRGVAQLRAGSVATLVVVGTALAGSAVASALLIVAWQRQAGAIGQNTVFELRQELFIRLQRMSVNFHERTGSGQVVARLGADIATVDELFGTTLVNVLQAVLALLLTAVAMIALDPVMATVTAAALVPLGVVVVWVVHQLRPLFRAERGALAEITAQVVETVDGIRAVQAFRREPRNDELFGLRADRLRALSRQITITRGVQWPTLELIFSGAAVAVVTIGGTRVVDGTLPIGVLAAFVLYVGQFFGPVGVLTNTLDRVQSVSAALERIAEVLDTESDVAEPAEPAALSEPVRGEVVFDAVQFGYRSGRFEIPGLDLRLAPGTVVAMLGATGAGKSTVAKLIARFHDPVAGRVLLDGVDLRDLADAQLRGAVTLLTQENFLFSGSVADNIRVARPSATDAEVEAAARAMGADAFIRALPGGYRTDVRRRGTRLSAGQRQLIAFARAHLADPAVVILDEATSALDIPTERALQDALRVLLAGRTALVIAHRLTTAQAVDRVLVMADGRVVEDDTPAALLAAGAGEFAALYRDGHGRSLHRRPLHTALESP